MLIDLKTIASFLDKYDVISFDVFDTLLVRSVVQPEHVFDIIHPTFDYRFRTARIQAEDAARRLKRERFNHSEVTLSEIYARLPPAYSKTTNVSDEIATETTVLTARPIGFEIFEAARALKKRVIATSDSYFNEEEIKQFLQKNGIQVDAIYSSCSKTGGKYDGVLFRDILNLESLKPSQLLHFGDNRKSDLLSALKLGINSIYIPKVTDLLFRDASYNLSAIDSIMKTESVFGSFIIARLAKRREQGLVSSAAARFAALFGGPLLFCYAEWLADKLRERDLDHLFLVARDGLIVSEVLKIIAPEIKTSVLRLSRRACLIASLIADPAVLHLLIPSNIGVTLDEIIHKYFDNADEIIAYCGKSGIQTKTKIEARETVEQVGDLLRQNPSLISQQVERERIGLIRYLSSENFPAARGALVDTGWGLSTHRALEKLLSMQIYGFYLGTHSHAHHHNKIDAMLTLRGDSSEWLEIIESTVELLELPFISDANQVERIVPVGDLFSIEERIPDAFEVNRRIVVPEIRQEILLFCRDAASLRFSESVAEKKSVLLAAFRALSKTPTPIERWTIGEILHDRYIHSGQYVDISQFTRPNGISVSGVNTINFSILIRRYFWALRYFGFRGANARAINHMMSYFEMRK